jgi:hypothetical protein
MCVLIFILCYLVLIIVEANRLVYIISYIELEFILLISVTVMFFLFMSMLFLVIGYLVYNGLYQIVSPSSVTNGTEFSTLYLSTVTAPILISVVFVSWIPLSYYSSVPLPVTGYLSPPSTSSTLYLSLL